MEQPKTETYPACPCCGEPICETALPPYCCVVCRSLGVRELGWRMNPIRVIDLETQEILARGPHLDLSYAGLSDLVVKAQFARRHRVRQLREAAQMEQLKRSVEGSFSISGP